MSGIKVLIADDEKDFLGAVAKALGRRGFVIRTAENGQEALEVLRREPFDVIVLDLRMPVLDGLAALKEIRKRDAMTPVILLSGHSDLGLVTEALKGGAADYLLKPCSVETLASVLETATERQAIREQIQEKARKRPGP